MVDAPERIWARPDSITAWQSGYASDSYKKAISVQYIRADIAERQLAEARAETVERVDRWSELYSAERRRAEAAEAERDRLAAEVEELRKDAARYRWLKAPPAGMSNRWPSIDQYPYQPEIDEFQPPQIIRGWEQRPEYVDEAVDAAMSAPPQQLLTAHARASLQPVEKGE